MAPENSIATPNTDLALEKPAVLAEPENNVEEANSSTNPKHASRLHKRLKYAAQSAILAVEMNPFTNEPIRYGSAYYTLHQTHNPIATAAVLGGSTLLMEGASALAAADIIGTEKAGKVIGKVNKIIPKNVKLPRFVKTGVSLYAGAPARMVLEQRDNPERTIEQNRRFGLYTASWLAGVLTVEGALLAEGLDHYTDPKLVGPAVVAVSGLVLATKWVKTRIKRESQKEASKPRYDLSQEELDTLEKDLVGRVKEEFKEEGIYAAWIKPHDKYANILRTHEAKFFPEVQTVTDNEEDHTLFLALVDTREMANRVVHATTVSGLSFKDDEEKLVDRPDLNQDATGFIVVDDLIEMGNFSAEEFYEYYGQKGFDLSKCISVETNFRIGKKTTRFNGLTTAQIAYKAVFEMMGRRGPELDKAAVFSSINRPSILSFHHVGLEYEPLMGRSDLHTPESELGKDYQPVAIPYNTNNIAVFDAQGDSIPQLSL